MGKGERFSHTRLTTGRLLTALWMMSNISKHCIKLRSSAGGTCTCSAAVHAHGTNGQCALVRRGVRTITGSQPAARRSGAGAGAGAGAGSSSSSSWRGLTINFCTSGSSHERQSSFSVASRMQPLMWACSSILGSARQKARVASGSAAHGRVEGGCCFAAAAAAMAQGAAGIVAYTRRTWFGGCCQSRRGRSRNRRRSYLGAESCMY